MTDSDSAAEQGAGGDSAPDTSSAPDVCEWDMADGANLEAVWLEFQREMSASCPVTGTPFDIALGEHPADDDTRVAEVVLSCGRCGRQVAFTPPDAKEIFGWAE